jgi:hypothetical protein
MSLRDLIKNQTEADWLRNQPYMQMHPVERPEIRVEGQVEPPNIDYRVRPQTNNPDGSYSTIRSMSIHDKDGKVPLIPTVLDNGTIGTPEQAVEQYRRTGHHLGKFSNDDDATEASYKLHEQLAREYADRYGEPDPNPLIPWEPGQNIGTTAGFTNGYRNGDTTGQQRLSAQGLAALLDPRRG